MIACRSSSTSLDWTSGWILATLMRRLCAHYPAYRFSQHFGYPTKAHLAAIAEHGPCPFHRLSFRPFAAGRPAASEG